MTLSYFFTDQLESEMKTEERVKKGELTADQADKLNEDWEDVSITLTAEYEACLALMDVSKDRC